MLSHRGPGCVVRRAMRRNDESVEETILCAAIEVLRESGVQRLTQVEVAERARIRQSHLTYYFPRRRDLLEAVTTRVVDAIAEGVREAVMDADPADPSAMLQRVSASISDVGHMRMFVGMIVEADRDPDLRRVAVRATRRMEAALAQSLGGGVDGKQRSRAVLAAIWGLGLYHFLVRPGARSDPKRIYLSWLAEACPSQR